MFQVVSNLVGLLAGVGILGSMLHIGLEELVVFELVLIHALVVCFVTLEAGRVKRSVAAKRMIRKD